VRRCAEELVLFSELPAPWSSLRDATNGTLVG
jgi:hypothetical protein